MLAFYLFLNVGECFVNIPYFKFLINKFDEKSKIIILENNKRCQKFYVRNYKF